MVLFKSFSLLRSAKIIRLAQTYDAQPSGGGIILRLVGCSRTQLRKLFKRARVDSGFFSLGLGTKCVGKRLCLNNMRALNIMRLNSTYVA